MHYTLSLHLLLSETHERAPLADLCSSSLLTPPLRPPFLAEGRHSFPCTEEITHKPWFLTVMQLPLLERVAARVSQSLYTTHVRVAQGHCAGPVASRGIGIRTVTYARHAAVLRRAGGVRVGCPVLSLSYVSSFLCVCHEL